MNNTFKNKINWKNLRTKENEKPTKDTKLELLQTFIITTKCGCSSLVPIH
jgi:hypothetical protein